MNMSQSTVSHRIIQRKWYTCFRERGNIYNDEVFNDYELGQKYIVNTLLKLSGTGLF